MTEQTETKKRSIQNDMIGYIVGFAIMLVITVGTLIGIQQWNSIINTYSRIAYNYTRTAAELIDGDKIAKYVETGEKDDHYYAIQTVLNATMDQTDLDYYYVFVPLKDEVLYVWDGERKDEDPYPLGFREEYMSDESKAATNLIYRQNPPEVLNVQEDSKYGYIGSAYTPIFNSAGDPVAVAGVDVYMPDLKKATMNYVLLVIVAITVVTGAALFIFFKSIEKRIINPIYELKRSTEEMVNNLERDEAVGINVHTGDEIEELADSISKMDGDLRTYIKELSEVTAERERMSTELNVAKRIQKGVLPRIEPPFSGREEFDLNASMETALRVGGDFYDFFMVDDDRIALVMADVSGKGIPASLFMMVAKIFIKNAVQAGLSPADALGRVNNALLESNDTGHFVTVWLAVIDLTTGHGIATNAGHEHPALMRSDGYFNLVKYAHSPAVSTLEDIVFEEHEFEIEPGNTIFVYTDGVTEAANAEKKLFGEDRLLASLNAHKDLDPDELLPAVSEDINAFVGDAPQFDDITMLAFRYNGKNQKGEIANE